MGERSIEIRQSEEFTEWLLKLRDGQARSRIITRVMRLAEGNPGDSRSVGSGIVELKIDYGPGYRVYYVRRDEIVIVLLCGGDKSSQSKDILKAQKLAAEF